MADENCSLLEVLEAIRPHLILTFENVLAHINTIYVLQTRQGAMGKHERYLRLKVCPLMYRQLYIYKYTALTEVLFYFSKFINKKSKL